MAKNGRPTINLDWDQFEKLCQMQCTLVEMAGWFKCSEDTIERRVLEKFGMGFAEIYAQKRGAGKIALRRAQYEKAIKGDTTMLIWLGKQYLGQKDKIENELSTKEGQPFVIEFTKSESKPS